MTNNSSKISGVAGVAGLGMGLIAGVLGAFNSKAAEKTEQLWEYGSEYGLNGWQYASGTA